NREMRGLTSGVAQRRQVRLRDFLEIEIGRDDVAEDEALHAELELAADLGDEAGRLERREQAERGRARNAGARREIAQRQSPLGERKRAQQLERLGGGIDRVAAGAAFTW